MALITIPLAHGRGPKTLAAILGTAASLLLTALLALIFTKATHLTGFSNEEAAFLDLAGANISLEGLLLAGMVIGALGVLDDVTVSQASTVLALRSANPTLPLQRAVRRRAAGRARPRERDREHARARLRRRRAADPADLQLRRTWRSGDALTTEVVATQVVATLVGSIGLIAAVPLTTALAALLALEEEPEALAGLEPAHAH